MEQRTLHVPVNAPTNADRPIGVEIVTLTHYDIPALTVLTPDACGDPIIAEVLLETSEELRLAFDGAFGPTTEGSLVGAWDGRTLVGAILVVRESPWDDAPDGLFVVGLVIGPEYRRQGITTALIAEVASRRKGRGFDSLALWIDDRHLEAVELYDDLGFEETD